MADDGRLKFIAGDRDAALAALDDGGATIVPESLASRLGLTVDQILRVPTADGGLLDLRVAGIVERSHPGSQRRVDARRLERRHDRPRRRRAQTSSPSASRPAHRADARDASAQLGRRSSALEVVPLDRIEGAIERRARPDLRTVRRARARWPS